MERAGVINAAMIMRAASKETKRDAPLFAETIRYERVTDAIVDYDEYYDKDSCSYESKSAVAVFAIVASVLLLPTIIFPIGIGLGFYFFTEILRKR